MKTVLGYLGSIILVMGLTLTIPAMVALIYKEYYEAFCFLQVAIVAIFIGFLVRLKFRPPAEITVIEAMVTSSLAWLTASLIGALPYVLIAKMPFLDAYFEAMSGFTTTGMTLIENIPSLPHSLLLWRAFTQWIGGIGIILLFILFIPEGGLGVGILRLYRAEAREERLRYGVRGTVRRIWTIYLAYTFTCATLLWILGLNPFEALTHAFTCLPTGGFSTRDLSIGAYNNFYIEVVLIIFMILGATNFLTHVRVFFEGEFKAIFKDSEVKFMLILITISSIIISFELATYNHQDFLEALRTSIFQVTSILTTTGYTTVNILNFPPLTKTMLTIFMVIGGGIGSTAGAIKIMRIIIFMKVLHYTLIKNILPPGTVKMLRIGRQVISEESVIRILGFFVAYFLLAGVLGGILTFYGFEPFKAFSAVLSAQATVGPCFMEISSSLPAPVKATLIFGMWAGRLEIIPVLILFMPNTWKEFLRLRRRKP